MTDLCVVFDLDDTLYSEATYARSGLRAAGERAEQELGVGGVVAALLSVFEGGRRGDIFDVALQKLGVPTDAAIVARMVDTYRSHTPQLELFDDAAWALDWYGAQGPLALLTDGYADVQKAKVAALGITPRFRHMVFTDTLGGRPFWKPSPAGFEQIERAVPEAKTFVYIADNAIKDFVAPNARGWRTVRIVRASGEYRASVPPEGGAPQFTIDALTALPDVLGQ